MIQAGPASLPETPTLSFPPIVVPHAHWHAAQARLAVPLASAAARFGALDERLRRAGPGRRLRLRLALSEAAALGHLAGEPVPADRLAIALGRAGEPAEGPLERGLMVLRWLTGGRAAADAPQPAAEMPPGLHPITAAAAVFAAACPQAGGDPGGFLRAAVAAALIGVAGTAGGALFLPQAMGGAAGLLATGTADERLACWIAAAEAAVGAALAELDRLDLWHRRAEAAALGYSGRTPARLLAVLEDWPVVTAPLAEQESGASRAAVQRNLDRLTAAGLIREITGRGRYRMWTAVQ